MLAYQRGPEAIEMDTNKSAAAISARRGGKAGRDWIQEEINRRLSAFMAAFEVVMLDGNEDFHQGVASGEDRVSGCPYCGRADRLDF